jgi:hypothetical protein
MLGQDRPYVTGRARSPATVAVRADHLALRDLVEDALPVPIAKGVPDIKGLLAEVVEVEDDGVVFSAVDARMVLEELDQVGARRSPLRLGFPTPSALPRGRRFQHRIERMFARCPDGSLT